MWFLPGNLQVHASVWSKPETSPDVTESMLSLIPSPTDRTTPSANSKDNPLSGSSTLDLSAMRFGGSGSFAGVPSSSSENSSNPQPSIAPLIAPSVNGSLVVLPARATVTDITTGHTAVGPTLSLPRIGTPVTDHSIVAQMSPASTSDLRVVSHLFETSNASGVVSVQTNLADSAPSLSQAPPKTQNSPAAGSNDSPSDLGSQPSPLPLTHAGGFLNDLVIDDESMYDHSLTEFLGQLPSLANPLDQDSRSFQKATFIVAGALLGAAGYRRWRNQRQSLEIRSFFKESSSTLHGFS
jgi:hypothetical protein